MTSILDSVKQMLGLESEYTPFDQDIVMHINSIFMVLYQLGVGPKTPLRIEDATTTWDAFVGDHIDIEAVKTYVYLRVRLLFDPPTTSFVIDAITKQYQELEWRLNVESERRADPE